MRYGYALVGLLACAAAAQPLSGPRSGKGKAVVSIRCQPDTLRPTGGDTAPLTCVPLNQNQQPLTNSMASWFTKSSTIATVSGSGQLGKVAAKANGSTYVGASLKGKRDSSLAIVGNPCVPVAGSINITPDTATLAAPGDTVGLSAAVVNTCNKPDTSASVTWISRNSGIATVASTGLQRVRVTAVDTGTTYVVGLVASGTLKDSARVCVAGVFFDVTPPTMIVGVGSSRSITVAMSDCSGSLGTAVTWVSRATGTATVASTGAQSASVTGVAAGNTYVVADAGTPKDSTAVTVTAPPSPPATANGCPTSGYLRLVNVSTQTQLVAAINAALPGDQIRMAAGTYTGKFRLTADGTSANPITICGPRTAIIDGGSFVSGYALHLLTTSWIRVYGIEIKGAQKGIVMDAAHHVILDSIEVDNVGSELIHLRDGSSHNVLTRMHVHHACRVCGSDPALLHNGEGIYLGVGSSATALDSANFNEITDNLVEFTTSEGIELKALTRSNLVARNVVRNNGNPDGGSPAAISTRSGTSTFECNDVTPASGTRGFQVFSGGGTGDGDNNIFRWNKITGGITPAISIHSSQTGNVQTDNTASGFAANCP